MSAPRKKAPVLVRCIPGNAATLGAIPERSSQDRPRGFNLDVEETKLIEAIRTAFPKKPRLSANASINYLLSLDPEVLARTVDLLITIMDAKAGDTDLEDSGDAEAEGDGWNWGAMTKEGGAK